MIFKPSRKKIERLKKKCDWYFLNAFSHLDTIQVFAKKLKNGSATDEEIEMLAFRGRWFRDSLLSHLYLKKRLRKMGIVKTLERKAEND